jgi:hypothetical protein
MPHPLCRAALAAPLALALLGCGGEAAAPPANAPPSPPPPAAAQAAPAAPPGHLARREVERVLTRLGPPWLLRRVMREEVLDRAGKFAGWRITGLPEEWSDIDLRPGDVVKRVNSLPLETPDEAWEAWKSVARARELRVSLERDGAGRELVLPIDGEPSAEVIQALNNPAPPPRPTPAAQRPQRGVVRIGGDDGGGAETY